MSIIVNTKRNKVIDGEMSEALAELRDICKIRGLELIYINDVNQAPAIIFNKDDKKVLVCDSVGELDIADFIFTYLM